MAVVSIRCHECDEVKRKKHIEMRGDGNNICDECKKSDRVREAEETMTEGNGSDKNEAVQNVPEELEGETEEEETEDNESKFTEQDALSW